MAGAILEPFCRGDPLQAPSLPVSSTWEALERCGYLDVAGNPCLKLRMEPPRLLIRDDPRDLVDAALPFRSSLLGGNSFIFFGAVSCGFPPSRHPWAYECFSWVARGLSLLCRF
ncbi:hypothetical protein GDO81_006147 [Engystomops pustulosus]|uniref:Uncharacterized protein n=1 Tax=Engystomops pustulosus TaxID=76066 RepID=A0AAV7CW42_ENGPU|nr:hypothetical protein GDO81_006147 [Engystomops pustulosus]